MKIHPNDQVLEELLLALSDDQRSLIRHLTFCGYCRSRSVYLPRPSRPEGISSTGKRGAPVYEAALERSQATVSEREAALEQERDNAPALLVDLLEQPAERRDVLLLDERFQTWSLFDLLVERSLESSLGDPAFGEHLGLFALRLADHLDRKRYGAKRVSDLQSRACPHQAP